MLDIIFDASNLYSADEFLTGMLLKEIPLIENWSWQTRVALSIWLYLFRWNKFCKNVCSHHEKIKTTWIFQEGGN